jgi:copper chaperone
MTVKTYNVPDVSCVHCKRAIEGALGRLDGVESVLVDVDHKTVDVGFDQAVLQEAVIVRTLAEEGYPIVQ